MPKLQVLSGREIRAILEAHGFRFARQKGSYMILQKEIRGSTITVPVPDHKEVAIGALGNIIQRSQLPRELFEVQS